MSKEIVAVLLLALAGFLIGGVYSTWKNGVKWLAIALGLASALAVGGAVAWLAG
ncbi:hypothetical protein [Amycolatopsis nigrescens]|uniref:hypothetical protein n=1 Tax=Amycolatopsis nigrescens TaxID=381445 RepID=UPI00036A2F57|nr:hypothetical protein [Amycolatopsis nigrescens]